MQRKLESLFRATLLALALLLVWSVWASAQTTNLPPVVAANPNPAATNTLTLVDPAQMQWLTFGLDRVQWLQPELLGVPLWQYLATAIFVVLAWFISRLTDLLTRGVLKRWTAKTKTQFDDLLVELIRGPARVVVLVILLHLGLEVFHWPPWIEQFVSKALKLAVAASITYVALKLVDIGLNLWRERSAKEADVLFDAQLLPIIRKSLKAFILIVAVLVTAQHLDFKITGLLASLSVGGLALGLAAQDTVANLFGAFSIFIDKPFRIGDFVRIGADVEGKVETIGLRSTRVRNIDGHLITVPNKTMGNANITNIAARQSIKTELNIGLTYDTPAERVQLATAVLQEIYGRHALTEKVWITFNQFADSSLNVRVVHWWKGTDYEAYLRDLQAMNLEVKRRFDAEKLDFAFPSRTVYLKQEPPAK